MAVDKCARLLRSVCVCVSLCASVCVLLYVGEREGEKCE